MLLFGGPDLKGKKHNYKFQTYVKTYFRLIRITFCSISSDNDDNLTNKISMISLKKEFSISFEIFILNFFTVILIVIDKCIYAVSNISNLFYNSENTSEFGIAHKS